MALTATMHRLEIALSDVDRGVYEQLELRLAQHPSEAMRYLVTRTLAYCLSYEEGIVFGKGISSADEPAVLIRDLTGQLRAWIEVGTPTGERLHKASKGCARVVVFTHNDPRFLQKEAASRTIHRLEAIAAYALDGAFLDALGQTLARTTKWEVTHSDGQLYVAVAGETLSTPVTPIALLPSG